MQIAPQRNQRMATASPGGGTNVVMPQQQRGSPRARALRTIPNRPSMTPQGAPLQRPDNSALRGMPAPGVAAMRPRPGGPLPGPGPEPEAAPADSIKNLQQNLNQLWYPWGF